MPKFEFGFMFAFVVEFVFAAKGLMTGVEGWKRFPLESAEEGEMYIPEVEEGVYIPGVEEGVLRKGLL